MSEATPQYETRIPQLSHPVIVIGGGLVGLSLAHGLNRRGMPVIVYERDKEPDSKERGGWAITIHWALEALRKCLPDDIFQQLSDIQVDPEQAKNDTGKFMFLNMETLVPKYQIPPSERMRINRAMFRRILTQKLDIRWQKRLVRLDTPETGLVTVQFDDGTSASSNLVIGCDGAKSKMRELLFADKPSLARLNPLPVRALGTTIRLDAEQIRPLLEIDPLLFQGCHPETGVFLWYSTVSTPSLNGSLNTFDPYYEGQIIVSWSAADNSSDNDIPQSNTARLQKLRSLTSNFASPLRTLIQSIPVDTTTIQVITLSDWPTIPWPNHNHRVTLAGDAAHAMTMYRGEAYNHGVTDANLLSAQIYHFSLGDATQEEVLEEYESEVLQRTHEAVLLSRQACLDAHNLAALKSDSPLVSKRARILVPSTEE